MSTAHVPVLDEQQLTAAIAAGGRAWSNALMEGDTYSREWWIGRQVEQAVLAATDERALRQEAAVDALCERAQQTLDVLATALRAARECIHTDRTAFADCATPHEGPITDPDDAAALADYDSLLAQIDEALTTLEGAQL